MLLKSRKPGKEIKTYKEFVKLNPKNIYLVKSTEYDYDYYLVDANSIKNEV